LVSLRIVFLESSFRKEIDMNLTIEEKENILKNVLDKLNCDIEKLHEIVGIKDTNVIEVADNLNFSIYARLSRYNKRHLNEIINKQDDIFKAIREYNYDQESDDIIKHLVLCYLLMSDILEPIKYYDFLKE
jgi:hypothetical protein